MWSHKLWFEWRRNLITAFFSGISWLWVLEEKIAINNHWMPLKLLRFLKAEQRKKFNKPSRSYGTKSGEFSAIHHNFTAITNNWHFPFLFSRSLWTGSLISLRTRSQRIFHFFTRNLKAGDRLLRSKRTLLRINNFL